MEHIIGFCLFNWILGGVFVLAAIVDCRISHIRYLSDTKAGEIISRILVGAFGCVLIGIGILLWLAPA